METKSCETVPILLKRWRNAYAASNPKKHLDLVKYLFEELNSPLNQTGHFLWEEADYLEVPPLSGRPQAVK